MEELITANSEISKRIMCMLNDTIVDVDNTLKSYRPIFNGERYITDKELSERIKVSRRTLLDWRKFGYISYIQFDGKILYKESEVEDFLMKFHNKDWGNM